MNETLALLLLQAVGRTGVYDPDETLYIIEDSLTGDEYDTAEAFLRWCHENDETFARYNILAIYDKYCKSKKS
jgi:hypothetical protein